MQKDKKITVGEYQLLFSIDDFNGHISKMIHQISIVDDIDPEELYNLDDFEDIYERYNEIKWINNPIQKKPVNKIELEGHTLIFINPNVITYGQFIDLEKLYSENFKENTSKIVATLYRMFKERPLKNIEYENYSDINIFERSTLIEDAIYIDDVYGNIIKYSKFRENIFNQFSNIFEEPDDINPDDLNEEELKIYHEEIEAAEKSQKNIWFDLLDVLADGDITKYDDVLETNVYIVLNKLSKIKSENLKATKRNQTINKK